MAGSVPAIRLNGCKDLRIVSSKSGEASWPKATRTKLRSSPGAANGIGQAFARRLAEDGVHIAIVDLVDGRGHSKIG
jgi:ribosomal protein L18